MRRWLRRNWIGLVAVAVLLPATVGITFATQWSSYFGGRASDPVTVPSDTAENFAHAAWTLTDVRRVSAASSEGAEIGLPEGSDLVIVTARVSPDGSGAEAPGCILLLEELDGTTVTRSWGASATDPIDYAATEGTLSTCDSDALEPYTLESAFVVADDASDDLGLAVTVSSELPRYLRFRL